MKRVAEFAKAKGMSRGRAYALVRSGALPAQVLDDGSLILDEAAMAWIPKKSRPLSASMAWSLLQMLGHEKSVALRDAERARMKRYIAAIAAAESPARELAEKVSARAELREFSAHQDDLDDLRSDARVVLSGIGAAGSGMNSGNVVEGYVNPAAVDGLIRDYLLKERQSGNVRLRVSAVSLGSDSQCGKALIAADLADWGRARELREADRIVHELLRKMA